jgi:hypothetical protein
MMVANPSHKTPHQINRPTANSIRESIVNSIRESIVVAIDKDHGGLAFHRAI